MSNVRDHDEISGKVEKLFESAKEYLKKIDKKTDEDIKFEDIRLGSTEIVFSEGVMIHLDVNKEDSLTIYKDVEAREYKILRHVEDENNSEPKLVSKFNICDDPSQRVFVGSSSHESYKIIDEIDSASALIKQEQKNNLKESNKKRSRSRLR